MRDVEVNAERRNHDHFESGAQLFGRNPCPASRDRSEKKTRGEAAVSAVARISGTTISGHGSKSWAALGTALLGTRLHFWAQGS